MLIRNLKKSDKSQFIALRKDNLKEFGYKDVAESKIEKEFREFTNSNKKLILIAENQGKMMGYIIATLLKNTWQKSCYIDDVFVTKNQRGRGIATALVKKLIKNCNVKEINKFRLGVEIKNKKALSLYKKLGFALAHYEMFLDSGN